MPQLFAEKPLDRADEEAQTVIRMEKAPDWSGVAAEELLRVWNQRLRKYDAAGYGEPEKPPSPMVYTTPETHRAGMEKRARQKQALRHPRDRSEVDRNEHVELHPKETIIDAGGEEVVIVGVGVIDCRKPEDFNQEERVRRLVAEKEARDKALRVEVVALLAVQRRPLAVRLAGIKDKGGS